ncbi:bifunctional phosphopantothenoylcysteine decarboxylase/phosphopantothenate--cysteine ligase CoaBC [Actinobacteria bacterium YIM 96077]|uniref:Coenzyme A biosynthesis bifunctional protein CoaBC n=1 Tax=Phytoactinopolyspora halophila TaxID=1981511 RepID=A0A329QJA0_9ACTN|nr:bifunctional phosphopantothenoylcysteine decarboxylase/phosphopantothenate--cysteine ligase CoaBC [Phytoactinopolyspora halophila]AYY13540.1 bifunctional phosphopantothenoylcysteine decarboxylase/phosphopantothenate--cysteine ligase CoaBC [Actinobacteria bacterium YIM 96077]RAW12404.1 bifunctional phosphopantothenoylcysteine decarboxylase/phosphopantothenate--cysteine ligase CoaBC [Phytoactinopolyspora halophila]
MSRAAGHQAAFRIVLGVSGGIAAYKACEVVRTLAEDGHDVRVVPTDAALRFVGEATWAALSGQPVHTGVFDDVHEVPHVAIGQQADLVLVVPATADLLARAASGRADDLLTSTLLTARCPVIYAPAMHTEMWEHPATVANVETLRARGAIVIEPAEGRLTGADSGKGRLPDPAAIVEVGYEILHSGRAPRSPGRAPDLAGRHVVVSAGGTREALDPVRFLGNRSSGRQGYALARAALSRGAQVTLVAANVALDDVAGAKTVRVGSAAELRDAVVDAAADADAVVMAAAVADFRPRGYRDAKIKKTSDPDDAPVIELERTADILAELSANRVRAGQIIVGFAAETGDAGASVLDHGRAKLASKGCDLLVVNEVGADRGFESEQNQGVILDHDGGSTEVPRGSKSALAHALWDHVVERLPA